MKNIIFIVLHSLLVLTLQAEYTPSRSLDTFDFSEKVLSIKYNNGIYRISALNEYTFKVTYTDSITYSDRKYAIETDKAAFSEFECMENACELSTSKIKIVIQINPFSIKYYNKTNGQLLCSDIGFNRSKDTTSFNFSLTESEAIYGTGARALPQNRRGYRFQVYNQANYGYGIGAEHLNYSIPLFLSSNRYMVLIDNPARAWFDIGKTIKDRLKFQSIGGNMTYYFIAGDNYKDILEKYSTLAGKQPMPPIWTFGNLQSRFGYRSQSETENIVSKMLEAGFTMDAIIIDLYWFGQHLQDGNMGNFSWDKKYWPDPDGMIKTFAAQGIKTITVSEPFFTRKSQHFSELAGKKYLCLDSTGNTFTVPYFFFGDAGLIDIFKPDASEWFWQRYKIEKERGIAGWWGDLGEPEVHPDEMHHINGTAVELHGVYGHEWVKMLYTKYSREYPDERLFKLGRAGYAGSQKYGLIPWSGDVGRSWSGLKAQTDIMLGMSMCGVPYMHSDAGGFAMGKRDSLLYIRWIQQAVFSPVFRPHGDPAAPPEPIFYHDSVQEIVKKSINLRYKMLPYNYTLAWETGETGIPMALPMFVEFENESISDTLSSQYMWGKNLLIVPVTDTLSKTICVFLPQGVWYDFYDLTQLSGNKWIKREIQTDRIPVFSKGGSIIPFSLAKGNTEKYSGDSLEILIHLKKTPGKYSQKIYFDDGKLKDAYKKGECEIIEFICEESNSNLEINIESNKGNYKGKPSERKIRLKIAGLENAPLQILTDDKNVKSVYKNSVLELEIISLKGDLKLSVDF